MTYLLDVSDDALQSPINLFTDGFIATEMKRTLGGGINLTDYVWLTEKLQYPKTALPLLGSFRETDLLIHLMNKHVHVDLDKIGAVFGKFYRFSFDSSDSRIKKWFFSEERKHLKNNQFWMRMESVANKVDDDVRSFWIATEDLTLENFSLEVFDGGWKVLLENVSLSNLSTEALNTISELKAISTAKCIEHGIPHKHLLAA